MVVDAPLLPMGSIPQPHSHGYQLSHYGRSPPRPLQSQRAKAPSLNPRGSHGRTMGHNLLEFIEVFTPLRIDSLHESDVTVPAHTVISRMTDATEGLPSLAPNTLTIIPPHILPPDLLPRAHKTRLDQTCRPLICPASSKRRNTSWLNSLYPNLRMGLLHRHHLSQVASSITTKYAPLPRIHKLH
jgi:hypothetical protein